MASNSKSIGVHVLIAYDSNAGHTERLAKEVAVGVSSVKALGSVKVSTKVTVMRVDDIDANILFSCDALIVGSPVHWSNMSGKVKTFFDNFQLKFGVYPELKMYDKVGAAFACHGHEAGGSEITTLSILGCMLNNGMIALSGENSFGINCQTEGKSTVLTNDVKEKAHKLGQRVSEVTAQMKLGHLTASKL